MSSNSFNELLERFTDLESGELIERVRSGNLTEEATEAALAILKLRKVNIPRSIELQERKEKELTEKTKQEKFLIRQKNRPSEEKKAQKLWKSRWLIALYAISAIALTNFVNALTAQFPNPVERATTTVITLFIGWTIAKQLTKQYISREDIPYKRKVAMIWIAAITSLLLSFIFLIVKASLLRTSS